MTDTNITLSRPKKSVTLSGLAAGNTAISTVGSGDNLHYRGYGIGDLAGHSTFEEVAYLLIHDQLPTAGELQAYRRKLIGLRALPAALRSALELVPLSAHPMDVLRTGCSMLGTLYPEAHGSGGAASRTIADRLVASFGSMLCYWHHFTQHGDASRPEE